MYNDRKHIADARYGRRLELEPHRPCLLELAVVTLITSVIVVAVLGMVLATVQALLIGG